MTVIDWLLDADPAIRWQALRDLVGAPGDVVAAERARVAHEGWGDRLLSLQGGDGLWEGGALFPARDGKPLPWTREEGQPWTATAYCLQQLLECGVDPADPSVRRAVDAVVAKARWENDGQPYFQGETEPCINGMVVLQGAYFGVDVDPVVERLLGEQMEDGGWNCEAENGSVRGSFHTMIRVLEGLLLHERATGGSTAATRARRRGEAYLLERRLLRRRTTGEVIDPAFLQFSYPARWHFDALRGLDYFRDTGDSPDPRLAEAVELARSKQEPDGTWPLEHSYRGAIPFELEDGDGRPSRWNTLRALRVLGWYDGVVA